jgi:hypothetical protein
MRAWWCTAVWLALGACEGNLEVTGPAATPRDGGGEAASTRPTHDAALAPRDDASAPGDVERGDAGAEPGAPGDAGGDAPGYSSNRDEFFGAPRCPEFALFCDSFEGASFAPRWQPNVSSNGSTLTLDATRAARGSQALRAHVTSGYSSAFLTESESFPAASAGFWGRVFFYLQDPIPAEFNHWTLVEAQGTEPSGASVLVRYGGIDNPGVSAHHFLFNFEKVPRPPGFNELGIDDQDVPDGRARQISTGQWHCVEWHFDVAASEAQFFWDGVERPRLHAQGEVDGTPMTFPAFTALNLGWTVYQPFASPYEVWIDELVIALERVGCQR